MNISSCGKKYTIKKGRRGGRESKDPPVGESVMSLKHETRGCGRGEGKKKGG
jgi:hypothetical protein